MKPSLKQSAASTTVVLVKLTDAWKTSWGGGGAGVRKRNCPRKQKGRAIFSLAQQFILQLLIWHWDSVRQHLIRSFKGIPRWPTGRASNGHNQHKDRLVLRSAVSITCSLIWANTPWVITASSKWAKRSGGVIPPPLEAQRPVSFIYCQSVILSRKVDPTRL